MKTVEQRLFDHSKVDPSTGCRLWDRSLGRDGYGKTCYQGRTCRAHRLSYQVFVGPIPDGLHVLHSCHTPACINPDHLLVGTHRDNMADMVRAGRSTLGERNPNAKLRDADVLEIRRLYSFGNATQKQLAKQFGSDQGTISLIVRGIAWKGVSCGA